MRGSMELDKALSPSFSLPRLLSLADLLVRWRELAASDESYRGSIEYNHRFDAIADRVEDLSPDERMRLYLGGLPERARAFIQTDAVCKPQRPATTTLAR